MNILSELSFLKRSAHWLTAILFSAIMIPSSAGWQSLTPGVDENTVAFWPFDDPEYINMTLTDASPNHYDLRLRLGGRLTPGKYGNALQIMGQKLPACMYAEVGAQHMVPDITTRAVDAPTRILQTLSGQDWTWELWLKLEQTPQSEVALMHLAVPSDPDNDHLNRLYMALTSSADAVVLRDWGTSVSGTHLSLPISKSITGGGWHHLAITKSGQPATYRLFVDGVRQSPAQTIPAGAPGLDQGNIDYSRGLIRVNYDRANFVESQHAFVDHFFDFDYGTYRSKAWSDRWRGSIKGPVSGEVTFTIDAWKDVRLYVNDTLVIDGWSPNTARTGSIAMTEGELVPIVLEYGNEDPLTSPRLSLSWSWPGHAQERVPTAYLFYSPLDAQKVGAQVNGDFRNNEPRDFEMRVGTTVGGALAMSGWVDELRFSRVARYTADFAPPESFTYSYGPDAPEPTRPNGPPLLFASDIAAPNPLPLASNKHVFIDDAILEQQSDLYLASNPWTSRTKTNLNISGDPSVVDCDGQIRIYTTNGDMWNLGKSYADNLAEGRKAAQSVYTSDNGTTFATPNLGFYELNGNTQNSVIIKEPVQGQVFEDPNPAVPAAARFKFTAYYMTRGVYLYYSADGIHWQRNEAIMEPFDCGGGVESFWDDQRGEYFSYIRNEGYLWGFGTAFGRAVALARTREPMKPWPFTPADNANVFIDAWDMPSMSTELPTPIVPGDRGHVYRARPLKYAWAPDTYLSFVWRGGANGPHNPNSGEFVTDLGVSRDGLNWRYYDPWYMDAGEDVGNGERIIHVVGSQGMVRRGNELWNYALVMTEPTGSQRGLYRYTQRLDGFVSLNAGRTTGTATTKPFTFTGGKLKVNVNTAEGGQLRVGLINADSSPIEGFALANCTPLTTDSVEATVSWNGGEALSTLVGRTVRMQLELQNGKLFAFQFVP